ncbi:unnamed protein product [Notodromas monacha]|uniref:PABS domain-containing protein n=1 Tax=Notodromas monacha TaxID=399045 RepID=A0A7R9BYN2_9CRUS|nr:unnamed protein product [Notodromas monacha]CAG0924093.1 unnamed protein product [Notodromas monacha]
MNKLASDWFSELSPLWPHQCFSIKVKSVLHEEQSKYQNIVVLDSEVYGHVLTLDGVIQCTERDEFSYQEMISFLPLTSHADPKKVGWLVMIDH